MANSDAKTATGPEAGGASLLCPKHKTALVLTLRGGAGYCGSCFQYVQAAGIPMPTIDRKPKKAKPKKARRKAAKAAKSIKNPLIAGRAKSKAVTKKGVI